MSIPDIDVVLRRLEGVVADTIRQRSRAGYFAAMYRRVTLAVAAAINEGRFDDPHRMARLDRVFAERYLDAYSEWRSSDRVTQSWSSAFAANAQWRPLIIQQLLVAMNTHINLDLGIAAATVAPGNDLDSLRHDFDEINNVLADLLDGFMEDVDEVSPWIGFLDRFGGRTDQALVRFSIEVARRRAWELAVELAANPEQWDSIVETRDVETAQFAKTILRPGPILPAGLLLIRLRESNDIVRVINVLGS